MKTHLRKLSGTLWHLPRRGLMGLVTLYQTTLSPDHGPFKHLYPYGYCRHHPTCSQYAIEQLEERGAIVGSLKAAWRILHCAPWSKVDEERVREILHR